MTGSAPTIEQSVAYTLAYDHFNKHLWGGQLPGCILVFTRNAKSRGHFANDRWQRLNNDDNSVHEISLNPDCIRNDDLRRVMSTLVHEMVHLWQYEFGDKCPTRPYHNKEWAKEMERVGLVPSHTGQPGGKKTGASMTHYIPEFGPFVEAFDALSDEARLPWMTGIVVDGDDKPKKRDKIKYECKCEKPKRFWAKVGLDGVTCDECGQHFESEEQEDDDD